MSTTGKQLLIQLPDSYKFHISQAACPHCLMLISGSGRKSLRTFTHVYLSMRFAAIELRFILDLSSVRYAEALMMCEEFDSFNAMTRALFGKYNAANAELKQMRRLIADGYIERKGRKGVKSKFRLTMKGQKVVDDVLRKHNLL